jgi:hypothetical protein
MPIKLLRELHHLHVFKMSQVIATFQLGYTIALLTMAQLYVTQNMGSTWTLISTYIRGFSWGKDGQIWFEYWGQKNGDQFAANGLDYTLAYTNDFGATTYVYESGGVAGFVIRTDTIFWVKVGYNSILCSN